jgi:hypothetical protein
VEKEVEEQETNLTRLKEDLEDVKEAAAQAEGTLCLFLHILALT